MELNEVIEGAGKVVDLAGVAVMILGVGAGALWYGYQFVAGADRTMAYSAARRNIGRSILFGLELLVAGDIIRSVAVSPTFTSVGVLGIIVLIRSFLSITLELEITGRWPWQKDADRGAVTPAPASAPPG